MSTSNKGLWPKENELEHKSNIDKAPYGVLSEYAESVYEEYNKKLLGVITARFREKNVNERTDFAYGLYIATIKGAQIKVIEVQVQDDGWYPAEVFVMFPIRKEYGAAKKESEFHAILKKAINSDEVKSIIKQLLRNEKEVPSSAKE
jgi:hypothetical protein